MNTENTNHEDGAQQVGTIDMTPTWTGILPLLLAAIEDGTDEGRRAARDELRRMAGAADRWNAATRALRPLMDEHAIAADEGLRAVADAIKREFGFTKDEGGAA